MLKEILLARNYPINLIDRAIEKARKVPRLLALKKVEKKKQTNRPVFAVTFDPRLPAIDTISAKHWRAMTSQDQYLKEVSPQPPLTAHKIQPNLRQLLVRAKMADHSKQRPRREVKGMKKCGTGCRACPYILHGKSVSHRGT